jgi:CheY-like chemotaxis protein
MDHMMEGIDGIETVKRIRALGYSQPVVALTANVVAGQSEIFLANGFDDFISKPINIRQLNTVLNKLIRDRQPPEIIEAARNLPQNKPDGAQLLHDPHFAEIISHEIKKAAETLAAVYEKLETRADEMIKTYVITTHSLKSALANIGATSLADFASRLEQAGKAKDFSVMAAETPAFLEALADVVEQIAAHPNNSEDASLNSEDQAYLREKLPVMQKAANVYDIETVNLILDELNRKKWPHHINMLLDGITASLLHSDFTQIEQDLIIFLKTFRDN